MISPRWCCPNLHSPEVLLSCFPACHSTPICSYSLPRRLSGNFVSLIIPSTLSSLSLHLNARRYIVQHHIPIYTMASDNPLSLSFLGLPPSPSPSTLLPLTIPLLYALLHTNYPQPRQRAWLLTALAACVMTTVSAPLVVQFLKGVFGESGSGSGVMAGIQAVRRWGGASGVDGKEWWAVRYAARVFQTYLVS